MADDIQSQRRLLKDVEVAAMLGVSRRRIWSMVAMGSMPAAIKVGGGRSTRWRASEIDHWIQLGCPNRGALERGMHGGVGD